jgi:hypothetical protein
MIMWKHQVIDIKLYDTVLSQLLAIELALRLSYVLYLHKGQVFPLKLLQPRKCKLVELKHAHSLVVTCLTFV